MNTDSLTLSPETVAEVLPDCKPGEKKRVSMDIEVGSVDDSGLAATVSNIQYEDVPEEVPEEMPEEPSEEVMPAKAKRPAALMAVLGNGKK